LVTHKEEIPATPPNAAKAQPAAAPAIRPAAHDPVLPPPAAAVPTPSAAPALPPAISIAPPPAAAQAHDDHPVPPESIPDSVPRARDDVAKPDEHGRSRIGKWISAIPLLGSAVDNARH